MNQPGKDKRKFTYFENKLVFDTLQLVAQDEARTRGGAVTVSELIRNSTLDCANKYRRKQGQPDIKHDTSGGKFAPGSASSARQCVVDLQGNMDVSDKRGKKMDEWKKIKQLPELLRLYRKCKVVYAESLDLNHNE